MSTLPPPPRLQLLPGLRWCTQSTRTVRRRGSHRLRVQCTRRVPIMMQVRIENRPAQRAPSASDDRAVARVRRRLPDGAARARTAVARRPRQDPRLGDSVVRHGPDRGLLPHPLVVLVRVRRAMRNGRGVEAAARIRARPRIGALGSDAENGSGRRAVARLRPRLPRPRRARLCCHRPRR